MLQGPPDIESCCYSRSIFQQSYFPFRSWLVWLVSFDQWPLRRALRCQSSPCRFVFVCARFAQITYRYGTLGGSCASCNKCGTLRAVGPGSAGREAGQDSPQGSATAASPPSGGDATKHAHPPDTGDGCGGAEVSLSPTTAEKVPANSEGCEEGLARAGTAFENGVKAYMREDPEVSEWLALFSTTAV